MILCACHKSAQETRSAQASQMTSSRIYTKISTLKKEMASLKHRLDYSISVKSEIHLVYEKKTIYNLLRLGPSTNNTVLNGPHDTKSPAKSRQAITPQSMYRPDSQLQEYLDLRTKCQLKASCSKICRCSRSLQYVQIYLIQA